MMKKIFMMTIALLGIVSAAMAEENKNPHFDKGYNADVTLLATTNNIFHINTSHGYAFGNGLYVGGGAGFGAEWIAEGIKGEEPHYVPSLFVDARWSVLNCRFSPFVDVKATQYIDLAEGATNYGLTPTIGLDINHFSLGVGYSMRGERSAWQLSMGFCF